MTDTPVVEYLVVKDDNEKPIFKITSIGIYVDKGLEVDDATKVVLERLGGYVIRHMTQVLEPELMRLRATCWQFQEERAAMQKHIEELSLPKKLDS